MASGCVIEYKGKRGLVRRLKYTDADGKQVMETLGLESEGWTKTAAKKELRDRLHKVESKHWRKPKPITLTEYAAQWLPGRERSHGLKFRSAAAYKNSLARSKKQLGHLALGAVTPRQLAAHRDQQLERYSPTTVNYDLSILYDLFKTAMREELVDRNPVELVERAKSAPCKWDIMSPTEVERVTRGFSNERARLVFLTINLCGLRRIELCNLRWRDISLIENTLRVVESKTEQGRRVIAIPSGFAEALWQYRRNSAYQGNDDYVFAHPRSGKRLDPDWYKIELHKACNKAGVKPPRRPMHDTRHSAITNDAAAGAHPVAVMAKAGHTNMNTTKRYLHLAGESFPQEAAALEARYGGANLYAVTET
jgi:integrase